MTVDLRPRNKALDTFHAGSFWWGWMLGEGVGLVLGCGEGMMPGSYYAMRQAGGGDPYTNDGYRVTARQASAMASAAEGLVLVERGRRHDWDALSEQEKERRRANRDLYQHLPVREDFVDLTARFAEWAAKSRGFSIW